VKTTLAALKIAATIISGKSVVYLALLISTEN
jgi:hypothetical protein